MFFAANRSKRSVALDLKDERGKEALLRLVDGADVFAQSMRAGTAEGLGLGADALQARNPTTRLLLDRGVRPHAAHSQASRDTTRCCRPSPG